MSVYPVNQESSTDPLCEAACLVSFDRLSDLFNCVVFHVGFVSVSLFNQLEYFPLPVMVGQLHALLDRLQRVAPSLVEFVTAFSVMTHFEGFQKGVIDSRDFLFFASVITFSLFGTSLMLRSLRA